MKCYGCTRRLGRFSRSSILRIPTRKGVAMEFPDVIGLPRKEQQELLDHYFKTRCLDLSPPDDPGCCCHLDKGHQGDHLCGCTNCNTTWKNRND